MKEYNSVTNLIIIKNNMIVIQEIIFPKIDNPDGLIKGKHRLVATCISVNLKTKVITKLMNTKNICIKLISCNTISQAICLAAMGYVATFNLNTEMYKGII